MRVPLRRLLRDREKKRQAESLPFASYWMVGVCTCQTCSADRPKRYRRRFVARIARMAARKSKMLDFYRETNRNSLNPYKF